MLLKKRNIVFLKHLILPQSDIFKEIQKATMNFYEGDLDVYFEDLQYKTDKILSNINVAMENAESLSLMYNTFANIKTNSIISLLTSSWLLLSELWQWSLAYMVWMLSFLSKTQQRRFLLFYEQCYSLVDECFSSSKRRNDYNAWEEKNQPRELS
jgi:hypothetical protein